MGSAGPAGASSARAAAAKGASAAAAASRPSGVSGSGRRTVGSSSQDSIQRSAGGSVVSGSEVVAASVGIGSSAAAVVERAAGIVITAVMGGPLGQQPAAPDIGNVGQTAARVVGQQLLGH
jgi:hypothetical protein